MRAAVLLLIVLGPATGAEEPAEPPPPRVGLALGGGSARGLAHVGVLQVLEEHGVPVDRIAGTSMGACVGSLYASGRSADEVAAIARGIDWARIFRGRTDRRYEPVAWRVDDVPAIATLGLRRGRLLQPAGAYSDYRIGRVLFEHLALPGAAAEGDFDRLPIPFRAVATDLRSGERVVLDAGDLPRAVRASMSLPVAFPPVELDGRLLVDGGLVDNVPAGVVRDLGADVVIAVDVGAPPAEISADAGVLEVVGRLTEFMMRRGNDAFAAPPDLEIRPDVKAIESGDFGRYEEAIAAGRAAALAALPRIEALLQGRRGEKSPAPGPPPAGNVEDVQVRGLERVKERLVRRRLRVSPGEPFDQARALAGLDAIWASNLFTSAWLELAPRAGGGLALVASVRERPTTRLGVGLSYDEADNVRGFVRLRNGNLLGLGERLDLLALFDSGQARFDASLGSVGLGGSALGWRLGLRVSEDKPKLYDDSGEAIGRTRFRQQIVSASLERPIGSVALVSAGLQGGHVEIDERAGVPFSPRSDTLARAMGRLVADTLDDRFFPTRGIRVDLHADQALSELGSDLDYGRAWGRLDAFAALGRRGLVEIHAFGGVAGDETPEYDFFRVGGPELVPGRSREELWGRWAGAAGAGLGVRLGPSWRIVLRGGAGNAWERQQDARLSDLRAGAGLSVAHSTRLGPLALDLGVGAGRLHVGVALGFQ